MNGSRRRIPFDHDDIFFFSCGIGELTANQLMPSNVHCAILDDHGHDSSLFGLEGLPYFGFVSYHTKVIRNRFLFVEIGEVHLDEKDKLYSNSTNCVLLLGRYCII